MVTGGRDPASIAVSTRPIAPPAGIMVVAAALLALAGLLVAFRHRFDYAFELIDIPSVHVAVGLLLAGLVFLALPALICRAIADGDGQHRGLLGIVIVVGIVLRLMMFQVNPVLEDDYHRYFWDGALTAHGLNPYRIAPEDAPNVEGSVEARLAEEAGVVMERINHPAIKTIYPPVTQLAFAIAYRIEPWSMQAWRAVCLAGEFATLALLLALLRACGRAPLWSVLYWWNPVAIKELVNSAHMEAILTPLILAALLLAVRRRPMAATAMLGLAIGAKLWPIMLAPLVLRPLWDEPRRLLAAIGLLSGLMLLWALPPWIGGIDGTSGFVTYAQNWKTNSALFPALEWIAGHLLAPFTTHPKVPGLIVRGASAVAVFALSLWLSRTNAPSPQALLERAALVSALLFLLSPAQFPWYFVWVLPFLAVAQSPALLAITATVPIYYASFYFHARDTYEIYRTWVVWIVWLPIWALMVREWLAARGAPEGTIWGQLHDAG